MDEPGEWMTGLLKKDRTLASFWEPVNGTQFTSIALKAQPLSRERGNHIARYEFKRWTDYVDGEKAKANSVF